MNDNERLSQAHQMIGYFRAAVDAAEHWLKMNFPDEVIKELKKAQAEYARYTTGRRELQEVET